MPLMMIRSWYPRPAPKATAQVAYATHFDCKNQMNSALAGKYFDGRRNCRIAGIFFRTPAQLRDYNPARTIINSRNFGGHMPQAEAEIQSAMIRGEILKGMSFSQRVWAVTARIPRGRVATYGDLAKELRSGSRAVGHALHRNPFAPAIPCHRVVGSDGRLVGYAGGLPAKQRMLKAEGVSIVRDRVDLARHRASGTQLAQR
jgi:O-6-methylguanine DNA methyltransferase